jgi:hypothetical protein
MVDNLKFGSCTMELSEELDKIGLRYIWQDPQVNSVSMAKEIIKEKCSGV